MRAVAMIMVMFTGAAQAADFEAASSLPFEYEIAAAETIKRDGVAFTVATLRIENGPDYVEAIRFLCEAGNDAGFTWNVGGDVLSLSPGEKRTARIASDGGDPRYTSDVSRLSCRVAGFDASLW